jgi:hypothetical protein
MMRPEAMAAPVAGFQLSASSLDMKMPESVPANKTLSADPNALMRDCPGIPASERIHDRPWSLDLKTANPSAATVKLVNAAAPRTVAMERKVDDVMEWRMWLANDPVHQPPQETPGRLQHSLTNYANRPTAQQGGG